MKEENKIEMTEKEFEETKKRINRRSNIYLIGFGILSTLLWLSYAGKTNSISNYYKKSSVEYKQLYERCDSLNRIYQSKLEELAK